MDRSAYSLRFPRDNRFAVELANVFSHRLPLTISISALLYALIALWLLFRTADVVYALLLLAMGLLSAIRTASLLRYRKVPTDEHNVQRRLRHMALYSAVSGLFWGSLGYVGIAESQYEITLVLTIFLTGVVAASTAALSHVPPAHMAFVIMATVPITVGLAAGSETHHGAVGGLLLVYLVLMYLYSCGIRAVSFVAIKTRIKNEDLVRKLAAENRRTATALLKAEEASRAKSTFLAAASHDLRQPMQSLRLLSESLSIHARDTPSETIARDIDTSVGTLQGLFDSLLDISRLEAGAIDIDKKSFPLQPLIDRLHRDCLPIATEKGLTLARQTTTAFVETDPVLLERILRNILSNALQYTDRGEVQILTDLLESTVRVTIRDTGKGIPKEAHKRVFDEFVQLDNPGRDRSRGQGLGLAIVARLSALLDLPIALQSSVGTGTALTITLPRAAVPQTIDPDRRRHRRFDALQGLCVAIVEDAVNTRDAFSQLLTAWGCDVLCAADGIALISLVDQSTAPPDVVIADYQLIGETGVDAIDALRRHLGEPVPALIISGDVTLGNRVTGAHGDIPVMRKPCDAAQLNAFLHRTLQARNAQQTADASLGE